MIPAYRNMDSYPYHRNQIPYPHYYRPTIEAIPPQMKVDPSKPPFSYDQCWPYAGNFGHPIPPHFCCGHNNFPCYHSYMPSYPHSPSPMYYSGACPAYSEPCFVPYAPQPHYSMELPRYEYDKYMPREHHCCGCPNHPCSQKEGTSVKIEEEHEPDGGKKVNDALVPVELKNYPYPFVWIPQEYASNKQLKNPNTMEVSEHDKISRDRKPSGVENSNADAQPAQESRAWNGWLPFDIRGASNMSHDGNGMRSQKNESEHNRRESEVGKMDQKHQSEQKRSEFPLPIFWLPYYNKQEEENGKTNSQENTSSPKITNTSSPKIIEEAPHAFKSIPVKSHVDEGGVNGTESNQAEYTSTGASDAVDKVTNARIIPVKQQREVNASLNQMEENVPRKDSFTGEKKRQPTSPPKGTKLPPVCLRVDPLRKKKNGNGSSRSPSPPSSKEHPKATTGETFKTPVCGTNDKTQPNLNHQDAPNTSENVKRKEKIIPVSECKTSENKGDGCQSQMNVDIPSEDPKATMEICTDGDECKTEDKKAEKGAEKVVEDNTGLKEVRDPNTPTDADRKVGRVLSDADAAVLIQATYRGYQVRKWEPLKKLKQIDEVRKEVIDVRGRVEAFERSSDLQNDDKEKVAVGETIMRLLLKLDTLQGLHPTLREIRKSLARELTILQERLDSMLSKKPQQHMQDFDVQKNVDVTPMNTQNKEQVQKLEEEKVAVPGDSSEGISNDLKDPCANDGGSESQSPTDSASNEGAKSITLPNGLDSENTSEAGPADALNSTSDLVIEKTAVELEEKSDVNDIPVEVTVPSVQEELPVGVIDEDINDVSTDKEEHGDDSSESLPAVVDDSARDELNLENHARLELPTGVLDEDERDNEVNISKGDAQNENEIIIEELPVGLLDENTSMSEVKKHDQAKPKTYKEVLLAQEGECNADEKTSSSIDDTAKETQEVQQQQLEEQEEVQSSGESDGWVKIEFQGEGELKRDGPLNIEVQSQSGEEVGNDTKLPPLTTQVNGLHEPGNEDGVCLEANDVNNISPKPMEFAPMSNIQKQEEPEEKIAHGETQEMVGEEAHNGTETLAQEKTEIPAALPASQKPELPVTEHNGGLDGDAKLLQENEKLREMMKKLLEAGNEQLSVISELTGRVKDLEKKLAKSRSKKVKTKRHRTAASKVSGMKSS